MVFRILFIILTLFSVGRPVAGAGLQTVFGGNGLTKIVYGENTLMDTSVSSADAFTIWEYRLIAANGSVQGGWGEINSGRSWNPSTNTLTWSYPWGSVQANYIQSGDTLTILLTVTNTDPSLTVEGLNIYPFYLHFPQLPSGFVDPNYPQIQFNTDGPGITGADYGSGMVVMANEDPTKPLYTGFSSTGTFSYHALIGSTYNSGQATFWPKFTRPVPPRSSDTYRVSFRFAPSGTPVSSVAGDVYNGYRTTWPYLVNWTDRRPIGTIFLSTSGNGDDHHKAGFPTNPRRYFNDASVNVTTSGGLASFQQRVLAAADYDVSSVKGMGGQGMITWDIEGEEYPQETSYVCDPEKLSQLSPEMESLLPDGTKLIDAYFKRFKDAGLKTGVCIRPQSFTTYPDGTADQVYLDAGLSNNQQITNAVANNLIRKIGYAKNRWGVSIIYVDSAVNVSRGPLEAAVFRAVLQAYPDILIIPEEHTAGHEAYSASWKQPGSRPTETRTSDDYKLVYPQSFSAVYIADAPVGTDGNLAQYDQYVQGVKGGDILMFRAFFQDTYYDGQVSKIYASAGLSAPHSLPAIISFSGNPSFIAKGASSTLSWNVTGAASLSISPSVGNVGGSSIIVSPTSTTTYTLTATSAGGTVQSSTTITVGSPAPTIVSFNSSPASITSGASSTLSWNTTGATSISISPLVGNITGSSVTVSPTVTTSYILTATGPGGSIQSSTTVTVAAAVQKPPVIVTFGATPASISAGVSSILSWNVTGAASLSISPTVGAVNGSSVSVTPLSTTTYTLLATNAGGSVQSTTTITVVVPTPSITSFTATPATISAGASTALSWNVSGATSLSISPGVGVVTGSSAIVSPAATTTYTLTAVNSGGIVQSFVTVTVAVAPKAPLITSFAASPVSINQGASTILSWGVTGAASLSISPSVGAVNGSSITVSPAVTTIYTLSATNTAGTTLASTVVTVGSAAAIAGTQFITSTTAHNPLNFYTGWIGMKFTVGPAGLTISSLSRYAAPNNTGTHTVKLISGTDGSDVAGGAVAISMAGTVPGQFKSAPLPAPLALKPATTYLLVTQESGGGDLWYDVDGVKTTQDAFVTSSAYGDGNGAWNYSTSGSNSFGPVGFIYTVPPLIAASPQSGIPFVTQITPRTLRNDYTGWLGMSFTTGPLGMNITGLGRYLAPGNSRTHPIKLVRASDGADLPGGTVAVSMAGASSQFVIAAFPSVIFLQPNTTYYVLSQEVSGGDQWYDQDSVTTTSDATVNGSEYADAFGRWNTARGGAQAFGPVTFTYTLPAGR